MSEIVPSHGSGGSGMNGGPSHTPPPGYPGYHVDEEEIDLRDVLAVLRRNVKLIGAVTVAVLAVTAFVVLRQPPEYRASGMLRVHDQRGAVAGGLAGGAMEQVMGRSMDPVRSQLEVMRSRGVMSEVVERTGLRIVPEEGDFPRSLLVNVRIEEPAAADTLEVRFSEGGYAVEGRGQAAQAAYGEPVDLGGLAFALAQRPAEHDEATLYVRGLQETIESLREDLRTTIRDQTDVVDIAYISTDPALAQRVVNTAIDAFQELSQGISQREAQRRRIFVEEQLVQTDSALRRAQLALTEFQRREAVVSSRERGVAQQEGLVQLEIRREELAAEREMLTSLLASLETDPTGQRIWSLVSSPSVAQNQVVAGLYRQMSELSAQRDSLTSGAWGSAQTNPDVQRIDVMLASARTQLVDAVRSQAEGIDARLAALDALRARNITELQSFPASGAEEVWLVQQVESVQRVADQLREEYQRARMAEAVEAGQVEVIDYAVLPVQPEGSGRALKLGLGLMLGLMLGSGAAFVKEHLNTSIQRKEDLEVLRLPSLAVIPQIGATHGPRRLALPGRLQRANGNGAGPHLPGAELEELVTVGDLRSSGSEAYRTLRTNLIFSQAVQSIRTLVVTSSTPAEGKTTTSSNLAVAFAQQGVRVLLVDCDLRKGRLHTVFNVPREPGLTQVILGFNSLDQAVRETPIENLSVLSSGTSPPNPAELIGGETMRELVATLSATYDVVIFDTPPLLAAADAAVLGRLADGVLLVVRAGHTDRAAAQQAVEQLRTVGANVVGAVLNDPDSKIEAYGGYYRYDNYGVEA